MAVSRHSILAKEGQSTVLLLAIISFVTSYYFQQWAIISWSLTAVIAWLYRDPPRKIPSRPMTVVSPVDGTVIGINTSQDRFLKRQALHIEIQMSAMGVYSLRSVTEGKVQQVWQENNGHGKCMAVWIQTDEGDDTVLVFRPGRWLKRLSLPLRHGDRAGHGQRIGHILFGARVEVYLPEFSRGQCNVGQKLLAGSDAIAEFIHT